MRKAFKAPLTLSLILFLCLAPAIEGDAKTLKVALLLEHDGDSPFNALLKAGLERAGRELGALCSTIIAPRGGEQVEIFRRVASESDLVIVATTCMRYCAITRARFARPNLALSTLAYAREI